MKFPILRLLFVAQAPASSAAKFFDLFEQSQSLRLAAARSTKLRLASLHLVPLATLAVDFD